MRLVLPTLALVLSACAASADTPSATASADAAAAPPVGPGDDGSYLERIDPLGGQWQLERIGEEDFGRFKAWVTFSDGGFINHGAGCAGGYPAFYRLDGAGMTVTRIEPVRIGKCSGTSELANGSPALRAAAAESERKLAAFIDGLASWNRQGDTLVLTTRDGTSATLARPGEPYPEIAGRWLIERIGGETLVTERRPPTVTISRNHMGAHADCNSMGSPFTIPAPGQIAVTGPVMSTLIGCAAEDQAEDTLMAAAMTSATAYRFEGDRLIFTGGPGMVLRRPPPPNRTLTGEYEACGNTLLGAYHAGPITLSIDRDTIRDNAQCAATYVADGPDLSLRLDDSEACGDAAPPFVPGEPVEVGGAISTLAVTRPDGFGFTEDGRLILRTNRGLLQMCRKGDPPPFGS